VCVFSCPRDQPAMFQWRPDGCKYNTKYIVGSLTHANKLHSFSGGRHQRMTVLQMGRSNQPRISRHACHTVAPRFELGLSQLHILYGTFTLAHNSRALMAQHHQQIADGVRWSVDRRW